MHLHIDDICLLVFSLSHCFTAELEWWSYSWNWAGHLSIVYYTYTDIDTTVLPTTTTKLCNLCVFAREERREDKEEEGEEETEG